MCELIPHYFTRRSQYLGSEVEVLCYRERFKDGSRDVSHSIVLKTTLPDLSTMQGLYSSDLNNNQLPAYQHIILDVR